jgi:hypothetical protein
VTLRVARLYVSNCVTRPEHHPMRVAVLHSAVPADAPLEDQDTLVQVDAVSSALARLGHEPAAVSCTLDLAALREELLRVRPGVVFNLVE